MSDSVSSVPAASKNGSSSDGNQGNGNTASTTQALFKPMVPGIPSDWRQWQATVSDRARSGSLLPTLLVKADSHPLGWGCDLLAKTKKKKSTDKLVLKLAQELFADLTGGKTLKKASAGRKLKAIGECLPESPAEVTLHQALLALTAAHLLPQLVVGCKTGEQWQELFAKLVWLSEGAAQFPAESILTTRERFPESSESTAIRFLVHTLMATELPLTLAILFPELDPDQRLLETANESLVENWEAALDEAAVLNGELATQQAGLLASWVRSLAMLKANLPGESPLAEDDTKAWWLTYLENALACRRPSGGLLLSDKASLTTCFRVALKVCPDRQVQKIFHAQQGKSKSVQIKVDEDNVPFDSEFQGFTVLQTDNSHAANRLAVVWNPTAAESEPIASQQLELTCGEQSLLAGKLSVAVTVDDQPLESAGAWDVVCRHVDEDIDYLELELPLSEDCKLQRQFCLGRKDAFFLLLDSVLCDGEPADPSANLGRLQHQLDLPLAKKVDYRPATETRDGHLKAEGKDYLVMPLSQPEWRADREAGSLTAEVSSADRQSQLTAVTQGNGRNLLSALWLDLDPRRAGRPVTWRRLTVAEQLKIVNNDVACGYRVQIGKKQWAIYRSLAAATSRTVLGLNLLEEFVMVRFDPKDTEDIIRVSADSE